MPAPAVELPLSRKQLRSIARATARINVWHGAVRSGKTVASLLAFLLAIAEAPPSGLIIICGRSLQTIERNVLEALSDPALFGPVAAGQVRHTRGATTAVILGRTVHLIGAADSRAEGRLRGLTAYLAYVDEATLLPEAFWTQLLARLSVPGARLLGTTNPDSPRHWLRVGYLDRAGQLDLRAWHFSLRDNPSLSPAYVRSLHAEYTGLWRRRMIDGAWVVAEGSIYDCWDEQHVVDELPSMVRYWVGVDYGTMNPFVAILLGLGVDGRLYACAEWRYDSRARRRQMTDAQYSAALRGWLAGLGVDPEWTFVDPSAASFLAQLWEDGHPGVARARNEVLNGIRTVSTALDSALLRVHRSCEGLLAELPGYAWDPAAAAVGEDRPIKRDDHSVDALRYVVHSTRAEWRHLIPDLVPEEVSAHVDA